MALFKKKKPEIKPLEELNSDERIISVKDEKTGKFIKKIIKVESRLF
jgi:hypothetical protein